MRKPQPKGHTGKHVAAKKHHPSSKHVSGSKAATKHHPTNVRAELRTVKKEIRVLTRKVASVSYNSDLPVCVPDALAASLYLATGYLPSENHILEFFYNCNHSEYGIKISDALANLMEIGLADFVPNSYSRTDKIRPGTIIGTQLPGGYHALTQGEAGVYSWGQEIPLKYKPQEIWAIDWHQR